MSATAGLTLFFTLGVGLGLWQRMGFLGRELQYYRELARSLGKSLFVTYDRPGELPFLDQEWLEVISNQDGAGTRTYASTVTWKHRRRLARSAVLKTNQVDGWWAAYLVRRLTGRPVVVRAGYLPSHFAQDDGSGPATRLRYWLNEAAAFRLADQVVVTTERYRNWVVGRYGVSRESVEVIPNFVDTELFSLEGRQPRRGLVGFVGRFAPQKNVAALIRAIEGLPGVRLRLIGSGELEDSLRQEAAARRVPVEFLGRVPQQQLPSLLRECEVFVLPSLYEGHPKALFEAMACGCPVLVTPMEGIEEYLAHGRTGVVAEGFGSAPLREALAALLVDGQLRERLGRQASLEIRERLSLQAVLGHELQLYRRMGISGA